MEEREGISKSLRDLIEIIHFTENVSAKIHGVLDEAEIYTTVKEEFVKSKRYTVTILLLTDDGSKLRVAATSQPLGKLKAAEKATGLKMKGYKIDLEKSSIFSKTVREGETVQVNFSDLIGEFLPQPLAYVIAKIMRYEKRRSILTPLYRHGKIIGAFAMTSTELAEHFIPSLRNLARHISTALELADEHAERKKMEEALQKSEERFRQVAENAQEWIWEVDSKGSYTYASPVVEKVLGYKPEEIVGNKHFYDLFYPEDREELRKAAFQVFAEKRSFRDFLNRNMHKNGNVVWLSTSGVPVLDKKGNLLGYRGADTNITDRKCAEEELVRLSSAVKMSTDSIVISNVDGKIIDVNEATLKMYRTEDKGDLIGKNSFNLIAPEEREKALAGMQEVLEKGYIKNREYHVITKNSGRIPVEMSVAIMKDVDGKPIGFVAISRDITQRKQAEEALMESEEKYRSLFENASNAILTLDLKGNVTSVNKAAVEYGFREGELVGKNMLKFVPRKYWPKMLKDLANVSRGKSVEGEVEINTPKGEILVEYRSNPIMLGENVVGVQAILRDITERRGIEEALRASEEKARNLLEFQNKVIDTAVVWIDLLDREGNVTLWNRAAEIISGYSREEVIGHRKIWEWQYPDPKYRAERFAKAMGIIEKGERMENYLTTIRCKDGALKTISWYTNNIVDEKGKPVGSIAIGIDVTERKRMQDELKRYSEHLEQLVEERTKELKEAQEQLLKAERLAAIGETAAMVGHDLRNPLQVIVNTLYLAKKLTRTAPPNGRRFVGERGAEELLTVVEEQVEYMNKIVSDLQDYARPLKPEFAETDLHQLIDETISTIVFPKDVRLSIVIEKNFPKLMADPAMMKRVFTNLVANALQAMPNGGQLKIRAFPSKTEETTFISVEDTGIGMPEENLEKLFQPLFTTRPKGTGLGLAVCKRLVEAHDGNITVESHVGKGSTFTVEIPLRRR